MFLELFDVCGWTNPHVEADNELVGHHVELSGETALHVGQVDCGEVTQVGGWVSLKTLLLNLPTFESRDFRKVYLVN